MDYTVRSNVLEGENWDKASFVAFITNFWSLTVQNSKRPAEKISAEDAQKVANSYKIGTILEFFNMDEDDVTMKLPFGYDQIQKQAKQTWTYLHKINDSLKLKGVGRWDSSLNPYFVNI